MLNYLKRLVQWVWEIIQWLWKLKFLLPYAIFIPIFYLDEINISLTIAQNITIYGLFLEFMGGLIVLYSIFPKFFMFESIDLKKSWLRFIKSFPSLKSTKGNVVAVTGTGEVHVTGHSARLTVKPNKANSEAMIKYLDDEVEYLRKSMNSMNKELSKKIALLEEKILNLNSHYMRDVQQTRDMVVKSAKPNITLEIFGAFCILVGLVLTTIPELIEKLLFS